MRQLVFIGLALVNVIVGFSQNLNRIEYFIDTDPGYGNATNVSFTAAPSANDLTFTVSITSLADGFHNLFIRSRDVNNNWSVVQYRPFYKVPASVLTVPDLNRIEYFIDSDPGYGAATNVPFTTAASVTDLVFSINVSSLSQGNHKLYVRSRNADNKWSVIQVRYFSVCNSPTPTATSATSISTSGFTANWTEVTGSTGYKLDVSADNFTSFVTGFNDKSVNGLQSPVTGLTPGVAYQYRVRAVNPTCTSASSATINVTTLFNAPIASAATSITSSGFVANWNVVTGATSYRLDISKDNFATFVDGYNNKTITSANEAVTGLSPATTYKYRVRATNSAGAISSNSNEITVTTVALPAAPTANAATSITASGFTASWSQVNSATSYRLDVSADGFITFVDGYNNKTISGTSEIIAGLSAATTYKYRVRTVNVLGVTSVNSNEIVVTTSALLASPIAGPATEVTGTSFGANWNVVSGATGYQLDVSTDDFATFIAGYNSKSTSEVAEIISGLTPATTYKYRVRAANAITVSANSNVTEVKTISQQEQSITFDVIPAKTIGEGSFLLAATASSSLPVSYSTSTPNKISISGSNVTLVNAGQAKITASQSGNQLFKSATDVSQTFCVNPAKPVITTNNDNTAAPTLTSSAPSGNQWYLDGITISEATGATFSATKPGSYTVTTTVETCISESSAPRVLVITGDISFGYENELLLYPNPVCDELIILSDGFESGQKVDIQILDNQGRLVDTRAGKGQGKIVVDVSSHSRGSYTVEVMQQKKKRTGRYVKE